VAEVEVVAQKRPNEWVYVFNSVGQVILHLGQLSMPSPARHLNNAVVLTGGDVDERTAPSDLAERDSEAAGEIGINLAVVLFRNGQGKGLSDGGKGDVGIIEDDRSGLHGGFA
jgi:hypothetical protein